MSFIDYHEVGDNSVTQIPKSLKQSVRSKQIIPFVGSGVSLTVKDELFPTWRNLLSKMADSLEKESRKPNAEIVRNYLLTDRLFEAAEEAWTALGKSCFHALLREVFQIHQPDDADLSIAKAIWNLQPKLIITTNYDSVLEWANADAVRVLNHQVSELASILRTSTETQPRIWHVHGHVDEADSLILAPTHYAKLYEDRQEHKETYTAARSQLKSVATNASFLFIGFGLVDSYVMSMLKDVLSIFESSLPPSYALLKAGEEKSHAQLWKDYNIQVVEFDDFGEPLRKLLEQLSDELGRNATVAVSKGEAVSAKSSAESRFPGCRLTTKTVGANGVLDLIRVLEDHFSFRLEPGSFRNDKPPVIYWPIRLREPGVIHAVQSFAAAALQQKGAKIILCLDNFGEKKGSVTV